MSALQEEQYQPGLGAGLFFVVDSEGRILDSSPAAITYFGLDSACRGQFLLEILLAPEDIKSVEREFGYVLSLCSSGDARGQNLRLESMRRGPIPSATLRLVRERRDHAGQHFLAIVDPDTHVGGSNYLRPLQSLLETVVTSSRDGVMIHDPQGRIIYANDAAASSLGFATLPELLAQPVSSVWSKWRISGDNGPVNLTELPDWLADQGGLSLETTLRFQSQDDSAPERWLMVSASIALNSDGATFGTAVFLFHDITARRRSDVDLLAALQRQERAAAEIAGVLGQIADGVVITDAAGNITFVNAAARNLFRQEAGATFDWNEHARHMSHPDGSAMEPREFPLGLPLVTGKAVTNAEWIVELSDGARVWLQGSSAPLRDAAGHLLGAVFCMRDITSQRNLLGELERANRIKDDFLTILSHELRTPLTPLVGYVSLLKSQVRSGKDLDPRMLSQALDALESNISQQRKIVEDLLDASHLLLGQAQFQLTAYPLGALAKEALAGLEDQLAQRKIEVCCHIDPAVPPLLLDVARMGQAVAHLLQNAISFSEEGGSIDLTVERRENSAVMRVRDEGAGIEPEFLPHVFDLFRQGASPFTRRHGGLGLGLCVVKAIVEAHNGSIQAFSEGPGHGTTIEVVLPLVKCV